MQVFLISLLFLQKSGKQRKGMVEEQFTQASRINILSLEFLKLFARLFIKLSKSYLSLFHKKLKIKLHVLHYFFKIIIILNVKHRYEINSLHSNG